MNSVGIIRLIKKLADESDKVMTYNIETTLSGNCIHAEIQARNICKKSSTIDSPTGFDDFLVTVECQYVCDFHSRLGHIYLSELFNNE